MTGRAGTFYTDLAIEYGTNVVGGVTPGKGGSRHIRLPVFDTTAEAMRETDANASMVFVPAPHAAAAMIEAIEAEVPLVVCLTERVPALDMVRVRQALKGSATRLVGPNSQGVLSPGKCKVGVMSTADSRPGTIGIVSRSASLTSEIVAQTSAAGLGQSTTIGIGADPIHGIGFVDCLSLFMDDDETDGIILIGEIGGNEEEAAAEFLRAETRRSRSWRWSPAGMRRPAGGWVTPALSWIRARDRRDVKIAALSSAGAHIAANADQVAETMRKALMEKAA